MGMGFAPTWVRQVSPPASQNHFNHWLPLPFSSFPPLPSPFLPSPASLKTWSGSSVSSPVGSGAKPRPYTHFGCTLSSKVAPGDNFFYKRPKKKTAVSARSAGTTFKNLHEQKFPGRKFRIYGGGEFPTAIIIEKKHWVVLAGAVHCACVNIAVALYCGQCAACIGTP